MNLHRSAGQLEESVQIHEFATAVTQNISEIEGQPWISKLLRISFSVRLKSYTILRSIWWNFSVQFFLNNGKFQIKTDTE